MAKSAEETWEQREAREALSNLKNLATRLAVAGVEQVRFRFDGSGDSGEMNEIEPVPDVNIDSVKDQLEQAFYVLSGDYDWCNNDGGFGVAVLDVRNMRWLVRYNIRETTHETFDVARSLADDTLDADDTTEAEDEMLEAAD